MPIDNSIYFQQQSPDILGSVQQGLRLKDMLQQQKIQNQAIADDQAMRSAAKKNVSIGEDGNPTLNRKAYLSDLANINPLKAVDQQKAFASSDRDEQAAKVKMYQDKLGITAQVLRNVQDQASYTPAVQTLVELGVVKPDELPANYHPGLVNRYLNQALTYKDQLDQRWKQMGFDQKEREINYQHEKNQIDRQRLLNDKNDKLITALKDDLDPNKARGGNLAKSQAMINSAQRVEGLFSQFPDGNVPQGQTNELAAAVAGLVNGGSAQSQHQIDSLTPQSMRGDANKIAAWITNDPRGLEQQKFMKMLEETTIREREIATEQVKNAQIQRLSAHNRLAKSDPETYANILRAYDIDPSEIKNGRYAPKSKSTIQSTQSVPVKIFKTNEIDWAE